MYRGIQPGSRNNHRSAQDMGHFLLEKEKELKTISSFIIFIQMVFPVLTSVVFPVLIIKERISAQ